MKNPKPLIYVVIPNYNGGDDLPKAIQSLFDQTLLAQIVVVDNASTDGSVENIGKRFDDVKIVKNNKNLGFAGGVNTGIRLALKNNADYVALFNNDALANPNWLEYLVELIQSDKTIGIVAPKVLSYDGKVFDSTGELYTAWGMPFPRGRWEPASDKYDAYPDIFGASGSASLYNSSMLKQIGLFDEDFFAYFEDVDLSFRAQLAGWKVFYEPKAIVRHKINATSSKISGFGTFHSFKNLPLLFVKNVPLRLIPGIGLRFFVFYWVTAFSTLFKDNPLSVIKGVLWAIALTPKKIYQRQAIQRKRSVSTVYIRSIITYDLPPDSKKLRKLRKIFTGS